MSGGGPPSEQGTRPAVFTIPSGMPFVDALAAGIVAEVGEDPAALAPVRVLLPTRRAVRALIDAFLRRSAGRPLLLPTITPIGDIDEDELALGAGGEEMAADVTLPPAIPELRRQLLLTRLILSLEGGRSTADKATRLAAELARLLDHVHTECLDFGRLADLVPEAFAEHWQTTLRFLEILTEHWPRILAEEGCLDPADRRVRLLRAQASAWRRAPPETPVIAAGSTGSIPATAELLAVVSRLPRGRLVLPGLDVDADDATWRALESSHPQYGMARLLDLLEVDRRKVAAWPAPGITGTPPQRSALINLALRPPAASGGGEPLPEGALCGVGRIDAPGAEEEARSIALIMRRTLEDGPRTAALITADRALARRVGEELQRWGIAVDDSAGRPLAQTPPGAFLRLIARMVGDNLAPVPVLAALKHPLAAGGLAVAEFRARVRRLERAALRGPRPAAGIAGLRAATDDAKARELVDRLAARIGPFAELLAAGHAPIPELLRAHVAMGEALAESDAMAGAARLWAGDAGEAAAGFIAELDQAAADSPPIDTAGYSALLDVLMAGRTVRPRYGRHPRLAIWGPLEARLQAADVTIVGGLNEGTWPPKAEASPWMSRPMMKAFGLPLPERRIGLSAHDFTQAFCAGEVWLTRARRVEGAPAVESRWLLRLANLLQGGGAGEPAAEGPWLAWQEALDAGAPAVRIEPPAPRPPVAARPRRLSVTQIETWMRDPYAIYARHILGLSALKPIDADPGAADYGAFVHAALDRFIAEHPEGPAADALERLLAIGRQAVGTLLDRPGVAAFWWPRFGRIARWFIQEEQERASSIAARASEVEGNLVLEAPHGPFELIARADRIDTLTDGTLAVIDYKTGAVPKQAEVAAGFAPQLPLEAAIAETGGFGEALRRRVSSLEYWRLTGGTAPGERKPLKEEPEALIEAAINGLHRLVAAFDLAETPYRARPRPAMAPEYSDYLHLARVKEWSAGGYGEEE